VDECINILIVDDDKDILYTIKQICIYKNWKAHLAESLERCLELYRLYPMNIVLVDYYMPKADGVKVTREIRKLNMEIPIIALTVEENEDVFSRFIEAGASDYSLKPIKPIDLIARIQTHLGYIQKRQGLDQYEKGISSQTVEHIWGHLRKNGRHSSAEELEENIGINQKTLYRYLRYLCKNNIVEQKVTYGSRGRPKACYRLKDSTQ